MPFLYLLIMHAAMSLTIYFKHRQFWRTVSSSMDPPLYGADTPGTLFKTVEETATELRKQRKLNSNNSSNSSSSTGSSSKRRRCNQATTKGSSTHPSLGAQGARGDGGAWNVDRLDSLLQLLRIAGDVPGVTRRYV
jgi:hypothetical protein